MVAMNEPLWLFTAYVFAVGLCVGSFLNVVIYRLPMGQSLVRPGSHCPECGSPVRAYDNVPLLSWLILRGLCRDCGASISSRYFIVELLTGVLTLLVIKTGGVNVATAFHLLLLWALIAVTFIDFDFQIIPDEISVGGTLLGLAVSFLLPIGFNGALTGALLGGGIFFVIAILYPGGMGGGDIKLMAAIGAFLGWKLVLLTIITGSVIGAVVGIFSMIAFGKTRKDKLPFGPFLAIGAIISMTWGEEILRMYLALYQ